MAIVVLVAEIDPLVTLDSESAQRLAAVGVTSIAIAADDTSQVVVLEGWALDPASAGELAISALGLGQRRVLRSVLQTLLPRPSMSLSGHQRGEGK